MDADFVFVDELVAGLRWDAKYATWDNFTGKPVDGYLANRIVGTKALCAALETAPDKAEAHEWWHYALEDEPYPDACFDFPITR